MAFRRPLAREVEQVGDDPPRAVGLLDEQLGVAPHVLGQALVGAQELAERDDRRERVVQLVRDAGDELADRLHLLGLEQFLLQAMLLGQVADDDQPAHLAGDLHATDVDFFGEGGTVGARADASEARAPVVLRFSEPLDPPGRIDARCAGDVGSKAIEVRAVQV